MENIFAFSDITERKRAVEEIKMFKHVLDSSTDAFGIAKPQGQHFYQNKAFEQMCGDIEGMHTANIFIDENIGN